MHVYMCVHTGQRLILSVIILILRQILSLNLSSPFLARLAGQRAQGIHFSLLSLHWGTLAYTANI